MKNRFAVSLIVASLLTSGAAFAQSTTVQGANDGARANTMEAALALSGCLKMLGMSVSDFAFSLAGFLIANVKRWIVPAWVRTETTTALASHDSKAETPDGTMAAGNWSRTPLPSSDAWRLHSRSTKTFLVTRQLPISNKTTDRSVPIYVAKDTSTTYQMKRCLSASF